MTARQVTEASSGLLWLTLRRQGIGASDAAAILGLNQYRTPLDVWLDKTSTEPPDASEVSEAAEWGHRLEPVIRDAFAEKYELIVDGPPGLLAHPDHDWMRCSPDGLAHDRDRTSLVEVKTAGARQSAKWGDDHTPLVPDEYLIQVLHALTVTGLDHAYVVALLGGQKFVVREVHANPDMQETIAVRLDAWWQRHIVGGVMPDPTPVRDHDLLPRLWEPDPAQIADVTPAIADTLAALADAKRVEAEYAAKRKELEDIVKAHMGEATTLADPDGTVRATWTATKGRASIDVKALRENEPEIAAKYTVTGEPSRTFRLKETAA